MSNNAAETHLHHLAHALTLARQSPPQPTNFCVGALLLDPTTNVVLATGYTLELPGNTHAEQCCLAKLAAAHGVAEEQLGDVLTGELTLYTTMEPCFLRLSGNLPCAQRILRTKKGGKQSITTVVCGVKEPEKFVGENKGRQMLQDAGIEVVYISGMEEEILAVATAGHINS